jgi:hypothetical protein
MHTHLYLRAWVTLKKLAQKSAHDKICKVQTHITLASAARARSTVLVRVLMVRVLT